MVGLGSRRQTANEKRSQETSLKRTMYKASSKNGKLNGANRQAALYIGREKER